MMTSAGGWGGNVQKLEGLEGFPGEGAFQQRLGEGTERPGLTRRRERKPSPPGELAVGVGAAN